MSDASPCIWPECHAEISAPLGVNLCERHAIKVFRAVSQAINPSGETIKHRKPVAPRPLQGRMRGCVYYARLGNRIKIGFTTQLEARMAVVPHDELMAFRPGSLTTERQEHARWAHLRTTGEWFQAEPDLLAYIATL